MLVAELPQRLGYPADRILCDSVTTGRPDAGW